MKTFGQVNAALRKKNSRQYLMLIICNLFSVMLITAYVSMMRAPTVLDILPEGGDSRKQVMAIFVLATIGCGVFTTYAASLFFRFKSRETGVFMALGAPLSIIRRQLYKELALISAGSCLIGALVGTPLAWCLWQLFRLFLVDTKEMVFSFDPQAYLFAAAFSIFVIIMLLAMGARFLSRTDIMDIVNEQRKSEPIKDVKPWCGPVGILLIALGGIGGYLTPHFFLFVIGRYPPAWSNITYLPLIIGLYMVLLHTVVRGWRRGKNQYKHIITRSMMKFQGRQTVRNMLVITVLLAGAYFATFYTPMLGTAAKMETENRPVDYAFHYRADQSMLTKTDIEKMADENKVTVKNWNEVPFANLGVDGKKEIVEGNGKYRYKYQALYGESNFLSESNYNKMTGETLDLPPGKFAAVITKEKTGTERTPTDMTLLTNPVTGFTVPVSFQDYAFDDMLATKYYVLDDRDYAAVTAGLTDEWREQLVFFDVNHVDETYDFAKQLYNALIDHMGPECETEDYYDRIAKKVCDEQGEAYWGDTKATQISFSERDSSEFKMYWKYSPQFRVLDASDFLSNFAVFLMLFIFIAIICFAAVLVIAYTRCLTIAINNHQVFSDLKHLGANEAYVYRSVREQVSKVYTVPAIVSAVMMYLLYTMIMFFNDNMLTSSEIAGLINCLILIAALNGVIWGFYRYTLHKVCVLLNIKKK